MYFWIYGARNTSLEKCLKSPLSEDSLKTDMVNGSKHCRNLNGSTFAIFIDPCEEIQGWKSLSDWCAKSYDCSLTDSQPMTSILFLTEAIYCNIFRCIYHRNEKYFVNFFFHFPNLEWILNIFKKKMTLRADVFLQLRTPKYVVREMSKKSPFRGVFDNGHGKRAKTLLKSERQHLYYIYWSLWRQLGWKKILWLIWKILGLFVYPLTSDDKYSVLNRGNILQHFQMHLSEKRKIFSEFFLHYVNLESILNIVIKKMTLIPDIFLNWRTPK